MAQLQEQLENIPGFGIAQDYFNDYAGEHFNKNPFEDENGKKVRLPADLATKREQNSWKRIQKQAWMHDRCFLGSCGVGLDCGLGLAPIVSLIPVFGPLLMYVIHARLIHIATEELNLPSKLVIQMEGQIGFDLLITFPPLIGCFTSWLNGCSTRNAASIFSFMDKTVNSRSNGLVPTYIGNGRTTFSEPQPVAKPVYKKKNQNNDMTGPQEHGFI
ncbi:hypothetical protein CAAN1_16S02718 [[Candida] anglica]|uniref:Uncharacterized protein n=1 Tax=[Candida] anglica TaxID=148631 RepID=A0ABP0EA31_9ASCO